MSLPESTRDRLEKAMHVRGRLITLRWLVAPLLCLLLPGLGVIVAFIWTCSLLWLGRQPIASIGLARSTAWGRTVVLAFLLAIAVSALSNFVLEPAVQRMVGHPADLSRMDGLTGNWKQLGVLLLLSWLVGALVEETVFRGFLIGFGVRLFGERSTWPLVALSSVIFGISHLYQGSAGMVLTAVVGLILSCAYVLSRRNLLLTMLAHGLIDTISVVGLFLGFR